MILKNLYCVIAVCGYVPDMKWQQLLPLALVVLAVVMVWRSSGRKSAGCGCKGRCDHAPEPSPKKPDAAA